MAVGEGEYSFLCGSLLCERMREIDDVGMFAANNHIRMFPDGSVAIPCARFVQDFALVDPSLQFKSM